MVSTDKPEDNKRFAEEVAGNAFVILSDPDKKTGGDYGVLIGAGFAKRWTFYIDKEGIITKIDTKVKPLSAGDDMVNALNELGISVAN
jgi:peroxiredoxin Q/BCP